MRRALVILGIVSLSCTAFATVGVGPAAAAPGAIVQLAGLDSGIECPLARLDLASGQVSDISSDMGPCSGDLALGPDGRLYGIDAPNAELVTYDTDLASAGYGSSSTVGALGIDSPRFVVGGLTFDSAGALWLVISGFIATSNDAPPAAQADGCAAFSCLYRVDPGSGAATFVAEVTTDVPDEGVLVSSLAGACTGQVYLEAMTGFSTVSLDTSTTSSTEAGGTDVTQAALPEHRLGIVGTTDGRIADIGSSGDPDLDVSLIDFSTDQVLYGVDGALFPFSLDDAAPQAPIIDQSVATVDRGTGAATAVAAVSGLPENSFILSLAVAPVRPCVEELPITFTG